MRSWVRWPPVSGPDRPVCPHPTSGWTQTRKAAVAPGSTQVTAHTAPHTRVTAGRLLVEAMPLAFRTEPPGPRGKDLRDLS